MAKGEQESAAARRWRERLTRFGRSGLTIRDFCLQEGVSEPSFFQWRKRFAAERSASTGNKTAGFLPVSIIASPTWTIKFPGGARIEAPVDQLELARTLVRELAQTDLFQADSQGTVEC